MRKGSLAGDARPSASIPVVPGGDDDDDAGMPRPLERRRECVILVGRRASRCRTRG